MVLTREFKETVKMRAERDPAFREALLVELRALVDVGDAEIAAGKGTEYKDAKSLTDDILKQGMAQLNQED